LSIKPKAIDDFEVIESKGDSRSRA
jgi:hypothetical protein